MLNIHISSGVITSQAQSFVCETRCTQSIQKVFQYLPINTGFGIAFASRNDAFVAAKMACIQFILFTQRQIFKAARTISNSQNHLLPNSFHI
uniref:Uncharacterized protein n=1 Tax=Anopheles minimus TaxID=112268 RepID=A0A182WMQ4_9DIPT